MALFVRAFLLLGETHASSEWLQLAERGRLESGSSTVQQGAAIGQISAALQIFRRARRYALQLGK